MNPDNNVILTEDGQRLTVNDGEITGTQNPGPGLAYETGNTLLNEGDRSGSNTNEDKKADQSPSGS